MNLPIQPPFAPMEATRVSAVPTGPQWEYEPKWDGFRCLAFRDGDAVELQSKSEKPLTRYFPEIAEALRQVKPTRFALDGELIVALDGRLSFDDLLQRIHPAASRVTRLARERPAQLIVFDLLVDQKGKPLIDLPFHERRSRLEHFYHAYLRHNDSVRLSLASTEVKVARGWLTKLRGQLDGIVAKQTDQPYASGERAMRKVKNIRTADCVVGGFRYASAGRPDLTKRIEKLIEPPGFTGRAPGGPSRWSTDRSAEWQPLRPELVVEVAFDHLTQGRFRHGTKFLRWRPDKRPDQCLMSEVDYESRVPLTALIAAD